MADKKATSKGEQVKTGIVATITKTDDENNLTVSSSVSGDELRKTLVEYEDEINAIVDDSYSIKKKYDGSYIVDLHPQIDGDMVLNFRPGEGTARIIPGEYLILEDVYAADDGRRIPGGLLVFPDKDMAFSLDKVQAIPVELIFSNNDGEEKRQTFWTLNEEKKDVYATLSSVTEALTILATLKIISDRLGFPIEERTAEPDEDKTGTKRRRKKTNTKAFSQIKWPNDPLTNAIMGRNENHLTAADYFTDGKNIDTGGGGNVLLKIKPDENTEIDSPEDSYLLDFSVRFWYTLAFNEALESETTEVYGSDILKRAGYKNPYKDESAETMAEAADSIFKAIRTHVAIDTTNEKRNTRKKNRKVLESIGFKRVMDAEIELQTLEDEGRGNVVRDFVVSIKPNDGSLLSAFPLMMYAESRDMLLTFGREEFEFEGLRLSKEARQMWFYVLQTVKAKKLSNKILFETMWQALNIKAGEYKPPLERDENGEPARDDQGNFIYMVEDEETIQRKQANALRMKKDRLKKQLEKMLVQASGGLRNGETKEPKGGYKYPRRIDSWNWAMDGNGCVCGVEVRPLVSAE